MFVCIHLQITHLDTEIEISNLPPGNVRINKTQQVEGCLVQANKHAIVDLAKSEELKNLADLRAHTIDTASQQSPI